MSTIGQTLRPLLVIEDNPGLQKQIKWALANFAVMTAECRATAVSIVAEHRPPVVTLDLGLPPDTANASEGFATLQEILQLNAHAKVIVVTGNDDRQNALQAVALGAYDFYEKPIDPDVLRLIVDRAYRLYELEEENRRVIQEGSVSPLRGIVGASSQVQSVCRMIEKVAPSQATALLIGESGTGKEIFAKALHDLSARRNKPFVAVNCAAIPEALLESEMFGHEKGAFTGAVKQTLGKIECANGGTFFLDEIGDMPIALQAKMLRFLQERVIERVGGRTPIPVDVRIICATHKDLEQLISQEQFRGDLFYRVSEIVIDIPPLREREGDKALLAKFFLDKYSRENGKSFRGFSREALEKIEGFAWPGNVRELENRIGRAVIMAEGNRIEAADLGFRRQSEFETLDLRHARTQVERRVVERALSLHNHNISHAAEALQLSRPALYKLMKKLGLGHVGQ